MTPSGWWGYRLVWMLLRPIGPFWLGLRAWRGKEDPVRLGERHGRAGLSRPNGPLLWVHAASVGETNAILPLLTKLLEDHPAWHALITTGTKTSAELLARRLPTRAIHQYIPLDHPTYVGRFLAHWQPQAVLWSESELWPNLLFGVAARGVPIWLVNGRMSAGSFRRWKKLPERIRQLLAVFEAIFAGSEQDALHFGALAGDVPVRFAGNLKYDTPELPVDALALASLQENIGERPVLLAASTHPNEELTLAEIHQALLPQFPNLLTIIVPRHAQRGEAIAELLARQGHKVALRSRYDAITSQINLYVADTMGELGLFYRLATLAFIGGSLVPHGGQNPLEPLKLGVPTISGLYMQNFAGICGVLEQAGGFHRLLDAEALRSEIALLLSDPALRQQRAHRGQNVIATQGGAMAVLSAELGARLDTLAPPPAMAA